VGGLAAALKEAMKCFAATLQATFAATIAPQLYRTPLQIFSERRAPRPRDTKHVSDFLSAPGAHTAALIRGL
jgi:hypothetical protein